MSFHGRGKVTPAEWLAFMEGVGIERTVLYPTAGLSWRDPLPGGGDHPRPRVQRLAGGPYVQADARFSGMALLPMQVPEAAVEELRRAVRESGSVVRCCRQTV